jgi:integrase
MAEIGPLLDRLQALSSRRGWPLGQHILLCAVETAMRRGEILGMEWQHVHERHVHLPRTKNGTARNVPLSSRARALIGLLQRREGRVVVLRCRRCGEGQPKFCAD